MRRKGIKMPESSLDVAIQTLPPELREMICKELIALKRKEREENGWGEVHEELKEVALNDEENQIVAEWFCHVCQIGLLKNPRLHPFCQPCRRKARGEMVDHFWRCKGCDDCYPEYVLCECECGEGCKVWYLEKRRYL